MNRRLQENKADDLYLVVNNQLSGCINNLIVDLSASQILQTHAYCTESVCTLCLETTLYR